MKSQILYHGSPKKLIAGELLPRQAKDVDKTKTENCQKAVYATDRKMIAIAMAILASKGVNGASLNMAGKEEPYGTIYSGWPEQKKIYLYSLPSGNFLETGKESHQYFSRQSVKPIKTELLNIDDYLPLIRKASEKEANAWFKKYNIPIKK